MPVADGVLVVDASKFEEITVEDEVGVGDEETEGVDEPVGVRVDDDDSDQL